jgi:serine/threonine-protein kinase
MGEVYLAEDTKLGRHAAVKVMSKQLAAKGDFVQRFYREARAMAKINHDNAVSVYDVDEEQGFHYVAMEFVDGKSMQKWMDELGKLSIGDALHVTLRCAEALQVAHNQNMIHRDIKPDNIMLTSKGKVKVADFGLAKATDEDMSMTQSGTGLGTPYYMAPEQARNAKHVDSRTDVYAIGVTLYYYVTGKLPFAGDSVLEIITNKEKGIFTPARRLNSEVPERLDLIIDKLIAKDLNARCKDCAEVIKLLTSLGLESPSLSFITAPDKVVQTASAVPAGRGNSTQVPANRTMPVPAGARTSAEDASRSKPTSTGDADQHWIVQYRTSQGKETIGKFTTAQIQQALKSGTIDQKAKAKKNVADQFMPIGYYPEFERLVEGRVIKDKADKKAGDMKSLYKEIERQYEWRGWNRWFKNLVSGTFGMISLVIWLTVIFGGIFAIWFFRQPIWDMFAGLMNSK